MLIAQRVLCSYFYYLFCSLSSNAQIILPSLPKSNEIFHLKISFSFRTFLLHLRETISSSSHFCFPIFLFTLLFNRNSCTELSPFSFLFTNSTLFFILYLAIIYQNSIFSVYILFGYLFIELLLFFSSNELLSL